VGETTGIAWCDHTFNPWIGCTKVSPGCANCYAESQNNHYKWNPAGWGKGVQRKRTSLSNWKDPFKWDIKAENEGTIKRVFCASLADVFDSEVPPRWRSELFGLISITPHLEWILLTKRPENILGMLPTKWIRPPANVRIMVTAENQEMADLRIPILLRDWKGKNGVSIEPMLGPIDLNQIRVPDIEHNLHFSAIQETHEDCFYSSDRLLDWVICGGESGAKGVDVRIAEEDNVRAIFMQCRAAGVPFMLKQWGEWISLNQWLASGGQELEKLVNFPTRDIIRKTYFRVGKILAGHLLDGFECMEFPEVM